MSPRVSPFPRLVLASPGMAPHAARDAEAASSKQTAQASRPARAPVPAPQLRGASALPLATRSPGALAAAIALRSSVPHSVDAQRTALSPAQLGARIGPSGRKILHLAGADTSATLASVYRKLARALFPGASNAPVKYVALKNALEAHGLGAELERVVGELPPHTRAAFFEGKLTPEQLFAHQAERRASWRESAAPMTYAELARRADPAELARTEAQLPPADLRALREGRMTPRAYAVHAERAARHDADVLIIGGGMAGLAAAQDLEARGLRAVVLEAKDHTGGRGFTDSKSFPVPWDVGGAWIHSGAENPLTQIAKDRGFTLVPDHAKLFAYDGESDPEKAGLELHEEMHGIAEVWEKLGAAGADVPASRFMPAPSKWTKVAANVLGALEIGADPEHISTKDYSLIMPERGDFFVKEGLGSIVASFAHGAKIELGKPVSTVKWSEAGGVTVTAGGETYRAKKLIVTASTGVLAKGNIAFDPPLPEWKRVSFDKIRMGTYDKVALEFSENVFGDLPAAARVRRLARPEEPIDFVVRPFGANMAVAFVGGAHGKALQAKGTKATVEFAVKELEAIFGAKVRAKLVKAKTSEWGKDEHTLGSYSHALPGFHHMRAELKRPVADTLFFAGEATAEKWAEHMTGALLTGRDAAEAIAAELGAARRTG